MSAGTIDAILGITEKCKALFNPFRYFQSKMPNGNEVLFNSIEEIISSYHQNNNGGSDDRNIPVNRRNRRELAGMQKIGKD